MVILKHCHSKVTAKLVSSNYLYLIVLCFFFSMSHFNVLLYFFICLILVTSLALDETENILLNDLGLSYNSTFDGEDVFTGDDVI